MTKITLEDPEVSTKDALSTAVRIFNEKEIVRGYSPMQHALGRSPDITNRVFPCQAGDCPELLVENASNEHHRTLMRMTTAEKAFLDWTYGQRLQRAASSKGRPVIDFQPGDLVLIWRQQVSGQSAVKGGSFLVQQEF